MSRLFPLIDLFEKGIPLHSGSLVNQPAWFYSAASFLKSEDAKVLEEMSR